MAIPPINYRWQRPTSDDHVMVPRGVFFSRLAERTFTSHATYRLIVAEESASPETRRHFFACVREAWNNLPENLIDEYPSEEHLRKTALIRTGFCHHVHMILKNRAEAIRTAGQLQKTDEYAIIDLKDNVIDWFTAKSQADNAMGKREFARSKTAVFDWLSRLIGTPVEELANAKSP